MDYAEKQTEKSLNSLERRLKAEYERAYIEAKIRADEYFEQYYARYDAEWKKWKAGLYTDAQFTAWQQTQIARGEKFEQLVSDLANTYVSANQVAAELTNGELAGVYTVNANYTAYQISKDYDGISFGLVDENTIKVLMDEDKNFTDFKTLSVNPKRNYEWNTKQVRSCITSAILQGKGIKEQTDSLMLVQKRNRNAAIRNARTAFGSAQNAGKLESMKQANDMGLDTQKMWVSAGDNKVRDSHAHLDGQIRATDEKFDNGLLFPLDPDGAPAEVYNCRCGMKYVNKKYHPEWKSKEDYSETKREGESYQAWLKRMKVEAQSSNEYEKYRKDPGKNAPASLSEFVKIKNSKDFGLFKEYARSIKADELSPLADFELYKNTYYQAREELIGLKTASGLEIKDISLHFTERIIGSVAKKRNGVTIEAIKEALTNTNATYKNIREDSNGKSQKILYNKVEVTINPDKGKLIQVNPNRKGKLK